MKTLQDCKDKIAKKTGATWRQIEKSPSKTIVYQLFNEAAELYGRYMRLFGRANPSSQRNKAIKDFQIDFYFNPYSSKTWEDAYGSIKDLDLPCQFDFYILKSGHEEDMLRNLLQSILHLDFETTKYLNLYDTLCIDYFETVDRNEDTLERKTVLDYIFCEHKFVLTKKTYYKKDRVSLDFTLVTDDDEPLLYEKLTGHQF